MKEFLRTLILVAACIFVLCESTRGQLTEVSTYRHELNEAKNGADSARIFWNLARCYSRIRYDSALWFGEKGIRHSRVIGDRGALARALVYTGDIYGNQSDYAVNFTYVREAIRIMTEIGAGKVELAFAYKGLGSAFYHAGNYDSALHYYFISKELSPVANPQALAGIGNVYGRIDEPELALKSYSEALAVAGDNDVLYANVLGAAGQVLLYRGEIYTDTARLLLSQAIEGAAKAGAHILVEHYGRMLSALLINSGELDQATILATQSLHLSESVGSRQNVANSHHLLANIAWIRKAYDRCIAHAMKAYEIGEADNLHYISEKAAFVLFKAYLAQGKDRLAEQFEEKYFKAGDAEHAKVNAEATIKYREQYAAIEKETEILELRTRQYETQSVVARQKNVITVVLCFLTLVLVIAGFIYKSYQTKKRNNLRLEQKNYLIQSRNQEIQIRNQEIEHQKERLAEILREREEEHAMLVHSEKMISLGQLTTGIAHELRNPINFIAGGISGILSQVESVRRVYDLYTTMNDQNYRNVLSAAEELRRVEHVDETWDEIEKLTRTIQTGSDRAIKVVNGLRTFAYSGTEKMQAANLIETMEAALTILQNEIKNRIEIIKDFENVPLVECNESEIGQVFLNVLINAVHATPGTGTIRLNIECTEEANIVITRVTDSGVGIPADILEKIFEPFFTTKPLGKGTGLGLSISNKIIQKHHGNIRITSEPGGGTEVEILLPIKQSQEEGQTVLS